MRGAALARHGPEDAVAQPWGAERLSLREFARARRLGTLSADAYVFYDVEGTAINASLGPMRQLWERVCAHRHPERDGASQATLEALRPSVRLGLGGAPPRLSRRLFGEQARGRP